MTASTPSEDPRSRLRIGHAERDSVIETLRVAAGEGRLTADELEERIERTAGAKTYADLDALVNDLPVEPPSRALGGGPAPAPGEPLPQRSPAPRPGVPGEPGWQPHDPLVLSAGWDNERRRGQWRVPPYICLKSTGATAELNFLEVESAPDVISVEIRGGVGSALIVVPDGWGADTSRVDKALGSLSNRVGEVSSPGCPQIVVTGSLAMSTLTVRGAGFFDRRRIEKGR